MKELLKKFMEFALGNGIVLIIGLISSPLITRIILPAEYGKASMFITATSLIIVIMTLGRDQAYIRYYNDEKEYNRGKLLRKSIKLPLILNLILGLILIILYKPISNMIIQEVSFTIVLLMLVHSTFSIISNFALLNIRMKQKGKIYSLFTILNKVSYLIFIVLIFTIFKNSYMTIVLATIISNVVMCGVALVYDRREWFDSKKGEELNTKTKELFKYGTPFVFSMSIIWIFQSIDKISLRMFSGYEEIGLYGGAMSIIALLNIVQGTFTTFWTPVAYEKYAKEPENTDFFIEINEIVTVIMLLISIIVIALKDIIIMFIGSEYAGAEFIFPFLVLMPIMYTISETTVMGINFSKNTKSHIYVAIISAISNVIGNLILVPKYGAKGAAISTGLAYILFFIARTYYSNKYYKVKYKLKKFWVCIIAVYILAAYSSAYKFNSIILYLTIGSLAIVLIMYRSIIINSIKKIRK
ncbi:oligosaccharide flippase family protein [Clostridium gasigenes]|uniref:oligosaccharide flippase family protein n=1 Tax=Clostridium gasigenes TaxID=94869 RepID=UPI001C0AA3FA|nr:oligosaccharide flippase family protein [Clostridium gasigenes]